MTRKSDNAKDVLTVALKYLSYRERSISEVRERLKEKNFGSSEINKAVDYLLKAGYLNDERFAELLASSRIRNKNWGPAKIAFDLSSKGIAKEIIQRVIASYDASNDSMAETAGKAFRKWVRKKGLSPPLGRIESEKAFRFLKGLGFPTYVIINTLDGSKNRFEAEE